jgi:superfamily I DNA/RNA helicase
VYEAYQRRLEGKGLMDFGDVRLLALRELQARPDRRYDEVVVDETQDLVPVQLQAVRYLAAGENIFLLADAAQSIYYRGISWRDAGMDVVGRTRVLRVNYRNTAEVLRAAASLIAHSPTLVKHGEYIPPEATRARGPKPILITCASDADHARVVRQEVVRLCRGDGGHRYRPGDIAVLAPTRAWCERVRDDLITHDIPCRVRTDNERFSVLENEVKVLTIHSAKGIEFPVVFVVGLTRNPPQEREPELDASRRLLYVGMTRAAERLYLVTTRGAPSLFLREIDRATVVYRDAP